MLHIMSQLPTKLKIKELARNIFSNIDSSILLLMSTQKIFISIFGCSSDYRCKILLQLGSNVKRERNPNEKKKCYIIETTATDSVSCNIT